MSTQDDLALLQLWREGDRRAGAALVDRHFRPLRRFFRNKVSSEADADDLLQRTFVGCVDGILRYREEASVRTWIFAIAHNILRDWIREKKRDEQIHLESMSLVDLGAGPSTAFAHHREQKLLLAALRRIPFESQVVLEFYYWEQLQAKAIGEILDMPVGTVRSRIRRAREQLQGARMRV